MLRTKGGGHMNMDRMTEKAQGAIIDCQKIGVEEGHQQIDGEHLHMALMLQQEGLIPKLLNYMSVNNGALIGDLQVELSKLPKVQGGGDSMYAGRRLNQLLLQNL